MCAACVEYTRDKLTLDEFKSALKETTVNNPTHQQQVERLVKEHGQNPDELKRLLRPKPAEVKDY